MMDEERWVIWNGSLGVQDTAEMGEVTVAADGTRTAYLDEPYDMVGPFSLDELEAQGVIAFAACHVMSWRKWKQDEKELRRQSVSQRRLEAEHWSQLQERLRQANEHRRQHGRTPSQRSAPMDERSHREVLALPIEGVLLASDIQHAFRRLAKSAHPDAGGSTERFIRITRARNALLEWAIA